MMNYQRHYNLLVERAPKTLPDIGYFERHRIVPGCMGGKYTADNVAFLTAEEHYIAHQLLVKIHKNNTTPKIKAALIAAAIQMSFHSTGKRSNNKLYGWIRREWANKMKVDNPMKPGMRNSGSFLKGRVVPLEEAERARLGRIGKRRSDDTKAKMSEKAKGNTRAAGRIKGNAERKFLSDRMKGNMISLGRIWVNDGNIEKQVFPNSIPVGFTKGRVSRQHATTRVYC